MEEREIFVAVAHKGGPVRTITGFRLRGAGKYDLEMVIAGTLEGVGLPGVTIAVVESNGLNEMTSTEELIEAVKAAARGE